MNDSLGDRMKTYENAYRIYFPKRTYILLRLDGKSFHTYTRNCKKPFDYELIEDFQKTTKYLCENIPNTVMAFHESDEITMLLCDFKTINTQPYFGNNLQKIVSTIASKCTIKFNKLRLIRNTFSNIDKLRNSYIDFNYGLLNKLLINVQDDNNSAEFDCRAWSISDPVEVYNNFVWRQKDIIKNAISMVAQANFSQKELDGKSGKDKLEILRDIGIKYEDYPKDARIGALIYKNEEEKWIIDKDLPIFTENPMFIKSKIPLFDIWSPENESY